MSKPRNKNRKPGRSSGKPGKSTLKARKWREIRNFTLVFALLATVLGTGLAAFKHSYDISHDLSVIGKGVPTVVQIHDPGCALCNQLRSNASSAIDHFDNRLIYRIADITTPTGRQLQRRHEVQHVTLLLFDGDGKLRNVLNGVKSEQVLQRAFEIHLERWG